MKRLWTLTAATIALLGMLFIPLLLSTLTLASATLTRRPDGPSLTLPWEPTYPHYMP